jgi:nifR3 family TIM-barrel protein
MTDSAATFGDPTVAAPGGENDGDAARSGAPRFPAGGVSRSGANDPSSLIARASRVRQSFDIAGRRIWPNAYLAPMSGVTDICFRRLVSRLAQGRTGLLVSEFVSVQALVQGGGRENSRSVREMDFAEEERPFSIQIFGADAGKMGAGAKVAEATGCDFIEINCGCPAPKVVGKGGGSGLLKDLPNLANILRTVKNSVSIPVTIKVRVGWNDDLITLFETLKIAEAEGAAAFVIHGRTRAQGYKGLANWDLIAEAKRRAPAGLPVIGNGDIVKPRTCSIASRPTASTVWRWAAVRCTTRGSSGRSPTFTKAGCGRNRRRRTTCGCSPNTRPCCASRWTSTCVSWASSSKWPRAS